MSNIVEKTAGLSSVDNALMLLRLLSARSSIRVAEAAEALGIGRSTAHRLLRTLRDNGFATQDRANSAYRMGGVLTEIGLAAIRRLDVRSAARPILEELRSQTGETVSLSVLEGQYVRFVDCLEGTLTVRVGDRTGIVLPSSATAGGKAMLAALPAADLALRYPKDELPVLTRASTMTLAQLREELETVRRTGFAVNSQESESRVSAVGVAVRDATGAPVGALAVVVPPDRYTPEAVARWSELLITAARAVERSLGAEAD
jgi:DNA-binding IclR family transcriptional regulator